MQNVAHILKGVLINCLVIEGGFPSEILSIYGNIRCFFEILKMLICNFFADPAQCALCAPGLVFGTKIQPQYSIENVVLIFLLVSLIRQRQEEGPEIGINPSSHINERGK